MVDELQQQIRRSGQLNPEMQQWVRQLRAADLIGQVRQALRGDDYQPDSIATAMAFWITVNYGINQQLDLTRLSSHEMVRQFTEVLGQDSSIRSMSDAERQRTAAQLYWRGTLLMGLYLQAVNEGNREAVQQFVQSSEQALRSMGVGGNVVNRGNRLRLG